MIVEHRNEAGICRVCGAPAPRPKKRRKDRFRVCLAESCRQEALRRDNLAKAHRYVARKRSAGQAEASSAIDTAKNNNL